MDDGPCRRALGPGLGGAPSMAAPETPFTFPICPSHQLQPSRLIVLCTQANCKTRESRLIQSVRVPWTAVPESQG
eukprot:7107619-Prymnesium_polylepis.3